MISLELWRSRIGGYISRGRKGKCTKATTNLFAGLKCSFSSILRVVLVVLLIIGGVEPNPGPPKKVIESEQTAAETMETREDLNLSDTSDVFILPSPFTMLKLPCRGRRKFGDRKRAKIFPRASFSCETSESDDIICASQSSVTEDLELFCKIPKLTQASSEGSLEIPPTIPPEIPTSSTCSVVDELTTAQKKLRSEVHSTYPL